MSQFGGRGVSFVCYWSYFELRSSFAELKGSLNLWTHLPVSISQSSACCALSPIKTYRLLFIRWYSLISGKPKINVTNKNSTWYLECWLCENLFVVDVAHCFLFDALNGRLFWTEPYFAIFLVICDASHRLGSIVNAASLSFLDVCKEDFPVSATCPDGWSIINVWQNRPDGLGMEIIVWISLLFWAVYLNYCALTHIPQTQSRVHSARENNWLIVANKNWLHKPTVSASPELMLGSGSPDIEHMKRVIRIRNENHIALLAARHSWRATTALHNVNVMRNYWVIIKRYCHLFLFLFWLLSHLLRQLGSALICEVIFLHEFLGVQVPHKELTVIGSREKATSLFGVVDCPHVVAVIVQTWKWALLSDCLFRVLHALVVILNVLIELLESPYFNSGVVRARNKCVGLFNVLHLVNPVHVAIEVGQ